MVARLAVCDCGGTAFYLDAGRGEVCRTCGRDGLRHDATEYDRRHPYRKRNPSSDAYLFEARSNPPKETDCPHCLYPRPAHSLVCAYGENVNGE
jgi:hypothetical protein